MRTSCDVEGCPTEHYAKGLCRPHYEQQRRGSELTLTRGQYTDEISTCAASDCQNKFRQRSTGSHRLYCSRKCRDRIDKQAQRASGWLPPHQRPNAPACSVEGCGKARLARGLCSMHLERVKKYGELGAAGSKHRPGEWRLTATGYVNRWLDGVTELQHRVVMERVIGRPLWPDETVHHKNGNRSDNRPENLELWSSSQPAGQRVEDKIAWARDLLARYA